MNQQAQIKALNAKVNALEHFVTTAAECLFQILPPEWNTDLNEAIITLNDELEAIQTIIDLEK